MNSKLAEKIIEAVENCNVSGAGHVRIDEHFDIRTEWEDWEEDSAYNVITIYIYRDGVNKLYYQDVSTLIKA
jgi:hypothetical protein